MISERKSGVSVYRSRWGRGWTKAAAPAILQYMFRSWRQSVRELGERVERLEGELGRLNMENADLKSQLKERDARIAKLESVLEESRRAGKRQAAPFSKDKPKRDPKKPGRKPGSKYGRQAVRAIPVPDKTFEAPCPEQCPCGGKVGAEGSIDLYQVDIPPIQPETWKFVVGHGHCQECGRRVRGQHPLLISKAFEVGTVHFGPRLLAFAAFQKMICVGAKSLLGVVRQDPPEIRADAGFPRGALHIVSCHAASCPACQAHPRCLGGGAAGQPRRLRR